MELKEKIYFELGSLNQRCKTMKKAQLLVPFLVREMIYSLKLIDRTVSFEEVFDPNMNTKPSKDVIKILKYIKGTSEISIKKNFDANSLEKFLENVDKTYAYDDDFVAKNLSCDLDSLCNVFLHIMRQRNLKGKSIFFACAIVNAYVTACGLLDQPILDLPYIVYKYGAPSNKQEFFELMLKAVENTSALLDKHKAIIKMDTKQIDEVSMKSVKTTFAFIQENPVCEVGQLVDNLDMAFATASKAAGILEEMGILEKIAGSQRYRVFKYASLTNLFNY